MKGSNLFHYFLAVLTGFLVAGVILLLNTNDPGIPIKIVPAPTPLPIKVYLSGDIENPGVYLLPVDSRMEDLINLSEIKIPPESDINLASKLYDGQHVHISLNDSGLRTNIITITDSELININEADMKELMLLPGIGETKANEIIMYRETYGYFDTIEDILNVPGIGDATFNQLRDKIATNSLD
ncbi:MAG: ComEA family DNA-binding protein [Anaerolineaceae bacterium]|nr:ComEA family DNA-binding protein [Anaerolineaceae bacterium]